MGTLKTFEELDIWKKGMEITMKVYELSSTGFFSKDYALKTQIRDACISITSNIAEGYERDGVKEQIQFLYYAKGSAGEVRSQLHTAKKLNYIQDTDYYEILEILISESKMINGFIKYIKNTGYLGKKYSKTTTITK